MLKIGSTDNSLWEGKNLEQEKGDDLPPIILTKDTVKVPPFIAMQNAQTLENVLKTFQAQKTALTTPTPTATTNPTVEKIKAFIANNKFLVGGAALVLIYLIMTGGLSASDKTVTTVVRYGRKG